MENNQALQTALEISMLNLSCSSPTNEQLVREVSRPGIHTISQCVPVPSSRHVGDIVGRQGYKIKALRAKTNTYIKTPSKGEDPVFVICGRPLDVSAAKREVLAAADFFTQRSAKKRIQQLTPSKDKELRFEVSSKPGGVDKDILSYMYIAQRNAGTGNSQGVSMNSVSNSNFGSPSLDSASCCCIPLCHQTSEPKPLSPHSSVTCSPLSSAIFGGAKSLGHSNSCGSDYSTSPLLTAPLIYSDFRDVLHDPPSPTYSCGSNSSDGTAMMSPKPIHKMSHPQRDTYMYIP